jgi:hypothetical protein
MDFVKETKNIIDNANEFLNKHNKKYYSDVLEFLNLLFSSDSKSILTINISKIAISRDIFESYNNIIQKYELNSRLFDIDLFFEEDPISNPDLYTRSDIMNICRQLSNNLLSRLNYKAEMVYYESKPTLKIRIIQ